MRRMYSENQLKVKIDGGVEAGIEAIEGLLLPEFPEVTESKTYVLQLVNGVLTWVEVE